MPRLHSGGWRERHLHPDRAWLSTPGYAGDIVSDPVSHPAHYGGEGNPHEVIACLESWGLTSNAYLWNVCKYVARADKKGAPLEDLKKARFYLERELARRERGSVSAARRDGL
jgi:hypothetical protein